MFDQAFDNLRKATETGIQMQQELFKKWIGLWPGMPPSPAGWTEQVQQFHKKWAEAAAEMVKKQGELMEVQSKAGLKTIEDTFRLAEVKDLEELRAKSIELWQKSFECLRQLYEAQVREFQAAMLKWTEVVTREAA
jgi:hypothetical protein